MQFIEPREVTIRIPSFEMNGTLSGTHESFLFESSNSHFNYWFPDGEIDSLKVDEKNMKPEQTEIIDACRKKLNELLG